MRIEDPDNKLQEFEDKALPGASIGLDELFDRVEEDRKKDGPIKSYLRSKGAFGYNWWYLIWHPWIIFENIFDEIRYAWQRAIRGWDTRQSWSIDLYYSKIFSELLTYFKKHSNGIPISIMEQVVGEDYDMASNSGTPEQVQEAIKLWDDTLDEMIEGFAYHYDYEENIAEDKDWKTDSKKLNRSLELFAKHFNDLWT